MKNQNRRLTVSTNKTLRLDNILIRLIPNMIADKNDDGIDPFDVAVVQMDNQLRSKGANPVGPLIQHSDLKYENEEIEDIVYLMIQADEYINDLDPGFHMEPVIEVTNCMYVRFEGREEDISIAYQKLQVEAYENDIRLKGDSYTVFVNGDDDGNIAADIFMEKEE